MFIASRKIIVLWGAISAITLIVAAMITGILGLIAELDRLQMGPIFFFAFLLIEAILLYSTFNSRAPIFGRIFWRGSKDLHVIAITFDDGPNEPYTSQILNILHRHSIKATFFVLGENVRKYPEAIKRAAKEGHEIGNHGYSHQALPLKTVKFISDEIRKTNDLIKTVVAICPTLFRAPYGWRNPWVNFCAKKLGCISVAWTAGVRDFTNPGVDVIVKRTVQKLKNGYILLFHDGRRTEDVADTSQVVAALPLIIAEAKQAGFQFVTVSEMLKCRDLKGR